MATGTVKWFNPTKGFGFIQPDGGGQDVFVHITAVQKAGLQGLDENAKVEYELESQRGKTSAVELDVRGRTVRVSSPDRVVFPERGLTKLDVVSYFLAVGDGILREPTLLKRAPGEVPEGQRGEDRRVDQRLDHAAEQVAGVDRGLQQVGPGELLRGREVVADVAELLDLVPYQGEAAVRLRAGVFLHRAIGFHTHRAGDDDLPAHA